MQQFTVGLLLDDGGRELVRAFTALAVLVLLALLLAAATPVVLVTAPGVQGGLGATAESRQRSPVARREPVASGAVTPLLAGSAPIETARRYLGVPYVFGGVNPATGLDCSGLVQLVFHQLGVALPRTAQLQYNATTRVSRDQLQPGDLVFFARTYDDPHDWVTHVGIYLGDGLQINAPTPGQVVSVQPVFSGFWGAHYAGAGRVAGA